MRHGTAMTEGNMVQQIVLFTIPLLLGNILQQLYNTADVVVVGKFVSSAALAAVGSSSPIINMLVGFFMGVSTGASAIISQFFGAGDMRKMRHAVHTTLFITIVIGIFSTFFGVLASPTILRLMQTPQDVLQEAVVYLRIYFLGISALMVYNMGSAILRAVGDSRRPLYFLVVTSVINVVLDVVFVVVFRLGIAGVAWATLIAQVVSAVLVMVVLYRSHEMFGLHLKGIRYDGPMVGRILQVGLPSGFQQSVTAISNVLVQYYVNGFGTAVIAGFSAYLKIDTFLLMPMQSISLAVVTFVGQNVGAGNIARAKKGVTVSAIMGLITNTACCVGLWFFGYKVLGIFSSDADVLAYGTEIMKIMLPLYFLLGLTLIYAGAMRGFGEAMPPMIAMTGSFVVLRQVFLFIGTRVFSSMDVIIFGYPVTWFASFVTLYGYYRLGHWEKKHFWAKECSMQQNTSAQ